MNIMPPMTASTTAAGNMPLAGIFRTTDITADLPLTRVNNVNCRPNRDSTRYQGGSRHYESPSFAGSGSPPAGTGNPPQYPDALVSSIVYGYRNAGFQSSRTSYRQYGAAPVESSPGRRDIPDKAIKETFDGANCRAVAARYGIQDDLSLKKLHIVSLKTDAENSVGAELKKGRNCLEIAKKHGIFNKKLLRNMQAFSAGIYGRQAILDGHSIKKVKGKYGITDTCLLAELRDFEKKHTAPARRHPVESVDAADLHIAKLNFGG